MAESAPPTSASTDELIEQYVQQQAQRQERRKRKRQEGYDKIDEMNKKKMRLDCRSVRRQGQEKRKLKDLYLQDCKRVTRLAREWCEAQRALGKAISYECMTPEQCCDFFYYLRYHHVCKNRKANAPVGYKATSLQTVRKQLAAEYERLVDANEFTPTSRRPWHSQTVKNYIEGIICEDKRLLGAKADPVRACAMSFQTALRFSRTIGKCGFSYKKEVELRLLRCWEYAFCSC